MSSIMSSTVLVIDDFTVKWKTKNVWLSCQLVWNILCISQLSQLYLFAISYSKQQVLFDMWSLMNVHSTLITRWCADKDRTSYIFMHSFIILCTNLVNRWNNINKDWIPDSPSPFYSIMFYGNQLRIRPLHSCKDCWLNAWK